ncbi:uncharacterized protein [Phaseolus vulgaris]|uniref:uncharacterized protein n=1 Tax=Phaseolus vulgaris TaxID=3885 RepID=UPI0035CC4ECB
MAQMLRKTTKFSWNETCENIFNQLKEFLPTVIEKPRQDLLIVVYLAVSEEAVSVTLVQDINKEERQWRMIGWSVELSEFDIKYKPRGAIKSQCLANFLVELAPQPDILTECTLYVDGLSNKTSCGAGVVLEGRGDLRVEQALQFTFKAKNNQAEYEAILVGLNLAHDLGAHEVVCKSDSQLVVGHIKGEFEVKEPLL